jgi:hypothetical protein
VRVLVRRHPAALPVVLPPLDVQHAIVDVNFR